ncbi:MAG: hypothetical protein U5R46_11990 [Gammaproteobacteria bacterium]|nr:hypothetical protein [Gammaproteobacteria bacterium]
MVKKNNRPSEKHTTRRHLLKVLGGGAVTSSLLLPTHWTKPVVDSVLLPVHAETSPSEEPESIVCFGASEISCGETVSGSTVNAPTYDSLPFCGTSLSASGGVWYHFVGPGGNVMVTLSTCNQADFDTKIGVFRGDCNDLICVGGQDDTSGCALTTELTVPTEEDVDYHVFVTGFGSSEGSFDLSLICGV